MAEEILRNIERHAAASKVRMELRAHPDSTMELAVDDNGVGFDPDAARQDHYGLIGLREQAALIGASLDIVSAPREGTRVRLTLRMAGRHERLIGVVVDPDHVHHAFDARRLRDHRLGVLAHEIGGHQAVQVHHPVVRLNRDDVGRSEIRMLRQELLCFLNQGGIIPAR